MWVYISGKLRSKCHVKGGLYPSWLFYAGLWLSEITEVNAKSSYLWLHIFKEVESIEGQTKPSAGQIYLPVGSLWCGLLSYHKRMVLLNSQIQVITFYLWNVLSLIFLNRYA